MDRSELKMDQIRPNELKWKEWTEYTELDKCGPNRLV